MIVQTSSDPLVVIVGATGVQGGSVIKALAASNKNYRIRGLTRDPSKPAAQALSQQGVEMVAAALYADKKDDAIKAFEGADILFVSFLSYAFTMQLELILSAVCYELF